MCFFYSYAIEKVFEKISFMVVKYKKNDQHDAGVFLFFYATLNYVTI